MKKKGFTLVELLGVVMVLIIVLGMVVVGYIKVQEGIKVTYYHSQEDSISLAATEYYNYNEGNMPKVFGDAQKVSLQTLINGGYIEEVKDRNQNECDLNKSSVIAYRDSYEKVKYEICLVCPNDQYKTATDCENRTVASYGLEMNPTIGNTKREYREGTWSSQDVKLNFKSGNDVNKAVVEKYNPENNQYEPYGECTLSKKNDIKQCNVTIDSSGLYKYVGIATNGQKTEEKTINIQIDKNPPTFDVEDPTGNISIVTHTGNEYEIDFGSDDISNVDVTINIKNIKDIIASATGGEITQSGIAGIQYSLEKEGSPDKYTSLNISNDETTFTKNLTNGTWVLKIEARDNSGNKTLVTIKYKMYQKVTRPTNDSCNNKTYNGKSQTYTKDAPTGMTFANTSGINAGNYTVTASLKEYYVWNTGQRKNNQTFVCNIAQKDTTIKWGNTTFTYNGTAQAPTASATGVSGETINIIRTTNIDQGSYTSKATCSSVTGGQELCNNYRFLETEKQYTINKKSIAVSWEGTSFTYNGSAQAPKFSVNTGISKETMILKYVDNYGAKIDAGNYTAKVECKSVTGGQQKCTNYELTNYSINYIINRKKIDFPTCSPKTYNGGEQILFAAHTSGEYTNEAIKGTNAGTYKKVLTPTNNYQWSSGNNPTSGRELSCTINRASIGNPPGSPTNKTYTGSTFNSGITCPTGSKDEGDTTGTDAGTYYHKCKPDDNHQWGDGTTEEKSIQWIIDRKKIDFPSCTSKTYNGGEQTLFAAHTSGEYTNEAIKGTNANTYKKVLTPTKNYQWSSGNNPTSGRELSCTINRANRNCSLGNISTTLNYPSNNTSTITYSYQGDSSPSITSSNTSVIKVSGTTNGSRTLTAYGTGDSTIELSLPETTNYNACSANKKISVIGSIYTISLNNQSATTAGTTTIYEKYNTGWYSNSTATSSISKITIPTKDQYTFDGYFTSTNGGGTKIIDGSGNIQSNTTKSFSSNSTIYAKWTCNETIKPVVTNVKAELLSPNSAKVTFDASDQGCSGMQKYVVKFGGQTATITNINTKSYTFTNLTSLEFTYPEVTAYDNNNNTGYLKGERLCVPGRYTLENRTYIVGEKIKYLCDDWAVIENYSDSVKLIRTTFMTKENVSDNIYNLGNMIFSSCTNSSCHLAHCAWNETNPNPNMCWVKGSRADSYVDWNDTSWVGTYSWDKSYIRLVVNDYLSDNDMLTYAKRAGALKTVYGSDYVRIATAGEVEADSTGAWRQHLKCGSSGNCWTLTFDSGCGTQQCQTIAGYGWYSIYTGGNTPSLVYPVINAKKGNN